MSAKDRLSWEIAKKLAWLVFTYWIYYAVGSLCLIIIIGSIAITSGEGVRLFLITDDNMLSLMNEWYRYGKECIPFGKLLDEVILEGTGILGGLIDFFSNIKTISDSWPAYCKYLMKDLAVLSFASFFIFVYKELKKCVEKIGCLIKIVFSLLTILVVAASFCLSSCFLFLLEKYIVSPDKTAWLYLIIVIVSCGIHTVSSAYRMRGRIFLVLMQLLLQYAFDVCSSIILYLTARAFLFVYINLSNSLPANIIEFLFFFSIAIILLIMMEKMKDYVVDQFKEKRGSLLPVIIQRSLPTIIKK